MKRTQTKFICILSMVLLLVTTVTAQKKFSHAVERSEDAGRIVSALAQVPESGFPRELIQKAQAVAVFPQIKKESALFTQVTQGYGVISSRTESGWTIPAFYQFAGGGYGDSLANTETFSLVLLFMSKEALAGFEKGGVQLTGEQKALAGPVGSLTPGQWKELEGAHILAYAYYNGKLKGTTFGKSFWKKFMLDPDNNINTPLYGMKGRELLAGKKVETASLPAGIVAYQEALQKHWFSKPVTQALEISEGALVAVGRGPKPR
jgi:lipid-binding SYLF domain-containing protein